MADKSAYQIHKNLFLAARANGFSRAIFAEGFRTAQFSLLATYSISYKTLTGTFAIGETVTGGSSAATGVVAYNTGTTLLLNTVVGTFTAGETVTGGNSSAHATSVAVQIPNYQVAVIKSNQESMPNPALAPSPDNMWSYVGYSDESDEVYSATGSLFNPTSIGGGDRTFNIESQGSRWYFIQILGYVSGLVNRVDLKLDSNFV